MWAPFAKRVELSLLAGRGASSATREGMHRDARGFFSLEVEAGAGLRYKFALDGKKERPDPASRYQPEGVHGASQVVDPSVFPWTDHAWTGVALDDLVFYELHVGTFTREGTFTAVAQYLDYLRDRLGVTAVELMPVAQFPGERNWGYDGAYLYAPQNSYGGPDGLRSLVDACHGAGLAVILDVVYNHLGPEGNYLGDFGPYFTDKYKTPWGAAVNYDDRGSDEVRGFVVGNALHWLEDYHFDGLRLDAIHGIYDFSPVHIVREISESVHALQARLNRRLHVIAESDLNDPRVVLPASRGGYEADAQWSDDFHHSVHALLTGERSGYYADFGEFGQLAKAYTEGFVYDGQYSRFRGRKHGASSSTVPGDRLVIALQNHDQVGNRPDGARLDRLVRPEASRVATGLLLLSPYLPLVFMGEEYAEKAPFYYFISHSDPHLVEAVRQGRMREFAAQKTAFVDPAAMTTFEASRLDHGLAEEAPGRETLDFFAALLRMRRAHPALGSLRKDRMTVRSYEREASIVVRRWAPELEDLILLYNFGTDSSKIGWVADGEWSVLFDSDDRTTWDGRAGRGAGRATADLTTAVIPPLSFSVLQRRPGRSAPEERGARRSESRGPGPSRAGEREAR